MTLFDVSLSELERDALTEIVNIGVSRAAASLRQMVGQQVTLSVPSIDILTKKTAVALVSERESDDLIAVRQGFEGAFSGRALLIFPQSSSLDLVRAVAGSDMSQDEAAEMESEALAETGNIILNGCLATMANMLQKLLSMSLPEVLRGDASSLFDLMPDELDEQPVLFLYIDFFIKERDIRGYIAMLMDLPSLSVLKLLINDFIDRIMNDDVVSSNI